MNRCDAIWHKSIGKDCMSRKISVYGYILVSMWKISGVSQSTEEACGDEQPCIDFSLLIFIKCTSCTFGRIVYSKPLKRRSYNTPTVTCVKHELGNQLVSSVPDNTVCLTLQNDFMGAAFLSYVGTVFQYTYCSFVSCNLSSNHCWDFPWSLSTVVL